MAANIRTNFLRKYDLSTATLKPLPMTVGDYPVDRQTDGQGTGALNPSSSIHYNSISNKKQKEHQSVSSRGTTPPLNQCAPSAQTIPSLGFAT